MFVIVGVCFQTQKSTKKERKWKKMNGLNLTVNLGPHPTEKIWEEMKGTHVIHCQHQGQLYNWMSKSCILAVSGLGGKSRSGDADYISVVLYPEPVRRVTPMTPSTLPYVSAYHLLTGEKRNPNISWTHFISGKDRIAHEPTSFRPPSAFSSSPPVHTLDSNLFGLDAIVTSSR